MENTGFRVLLTTGMNAKLKLIAALAAVQMIVPAIFAQPRGTVVVPAPTVVVPGQTVVAPSPVVLSSMYEITGRVLEINPSRIVIRTRGPERTDWVILRREDTRFWAQVRVGDTVSIKYNMMATDVTPVVPLVAPRHRR
jgi:hypothetical protein